MNKKGYIVAVFFLMLTISACRNKPGQAGLDAHDSQPVTELSEPDTASATVQEESSKEEEITSTSTSISSSSHHSHESSDYDNMRGFDPASEDDMEDNGMSRYMENNDDQGWD